MIKQIELSDPQADIVESTSQRNLFHSGVGSGKSHCIGLIAADFVLNNPEVRGFIGANTYSQLSKSTLDRIFKVWEGTLNIKRGSHYVSNIQPPKNFKVIGPRLTSYEHTISFSNGGLIFTASLDNYKVIDGTEFGWACLDETKDTKEEAVREVITARLRQQGMYLSPAGTICKEKKTDEYKGFNPLYIFTSPAKTDWLAEWFDIPEHFEEINATIFSETDYFRKKSGDKLVVISSTYHNSVNLSEGYIERLIDDNKHNSQRINMLIYGSPLAKTGGEYFSRFDRLVHLKYIPINQNLPIHISFDFNRNPYMTATCFQTWWDDVKQKWVVNKFDEFCLETPNNYTEALCLDIEFKYSHILKNGLFFYGDYSGNAGRTNSIDDDYDVINRILKKYIGSYSDRVITNKGISSRHDFMNKILYGGLPIEYFQAPSCKHSTNEYEYLKEDTNSGKLKQLATNPNTGVQYQKYGHIADCFVGETMITTDKGQKRIDEIKVGDMVLTRKGFKSVKNVLNKGIKDVCEFDFSGYKLECTPEHKVFTKERGFVSANSISVNTLCVYDNVRNKIRYSTIESDVIRSIATKKREVFDLTIEEVPEFFANNILVHNCDEYFFTSAYSQFYNI